MQANQLAGVALNGTTVFVASFGTSGTFPNLSVKSQLIGFNAASGAKVFANDLDGIATSETAFADGVYVVEVAMPMTPGGMPMPSIARKLLSVSNAGKVNWNLTID